MKLEEVMNICSCEAQKWQDKYQHAISFEKFWEVSKSLWLEILDDLMLPEEVEAAFFLISKEVISSVNRNIRAKLVKAAIKVDASDKNLNAIHLRLWKILGFLQSATELTPSTWEMFKQENQEWSLPDAYSWLDDYSQLFLQAVQTFGSCFIDSGLVLQKYLIELNEYLYRLPLLCLDWLLKLENEFDGVNSTVISGFTFHVMNVLNSFDQYETLLLSPEFEGSLHSAKETVRKFSL